MITKNDIWTDKETEQKALVLRVDDYHVYYQQGTGKEKFIKGVLIWEFLEQFDNDIVLLNERKADGQKPVAVSLGEL